jgi:hypothetical protein
VPVLRAMAAREVRRHASRRLGRWTDRVLDQTDGEPMRLTDWWPPGAPPWISAIVRTTAGTIDFTTSTAAAVRRRPGRMSSPAPVLGLR